MLVNFLIGIVLFYLCVLVFMFLFQRNLMYYPETKIFAPAHYGVKDVQVIPLLTEDKTAIEAWYLPPLNPALPHIIYFHGNAGHIGDRMAKISHFVEAGFGVLALSYRGYGNSKGVPSETGLYDDARTAIQHALGELRLDPSRLIIYGESLGTGIATHTAKILADKGTPAGGLVLEAPYISVARRSQELYPYLPAFYLVRDKYHTMDKIAHIHCPLLIFHGEKDTVIPIHHGHRLMEIAKEPKRSVFFPEVDHTSFDYPTLAEELVRFTRENGRENREAEIGNPELGK